MNENVEIRLVKKEDMAFIYSTWLKSYFYSSEFTKKLSKKIYFDMHHKAIDRFLDRGGLIYIAHAKDEPDVILGYMATDMEDTIIQYIYVKKTFREMGIAKALTKNLNIEKLTFTHFTDDTKWILKKYPTLTYNPYYL